MDSSEGHRPSTPAGGAHRSRPHESGVRFLMHDGDLSDSGSLIVLIRELEPDEIYTSVRRATSR
jgi:GDP-D-mannose dehydratase